jgi:hypothetical protein
MKKELGKLKKNTSLIHNLLKEITSDGKHLFVGRQQGFLGETI